jgi:hypothetical protein
MMAPRTALASRSSANSGASPGEKAVEIGQHHAVPRRAVGRQEAVERLQIDLVVGNRMSQGLGAHRGLANRCDAAKPRSGRLPARSTPLPRQQLGDAPHRMIGKPGCPGVIVTIARQS